jgi:predicted permease
VLLAAGSLGGVTLSFALVGAVRRNAPGNIPGIDSVAIDWRVLLFAIVVTGAAAGICAVAPALQSWSRDAMPALQGSGRTVARDGGAIGRALAGCEIALAVVLMAAALLVTRTFLNLRAIDVGFDADHVLAFDVPQPPNRYPDAKASLQFAERLLPRIAALPGVRKASAVLLRPLWGVAGMDWTVVIEGQAPRDAAQNPLTNLEAIAPGYFDTMDIPVVEGRAIDERDGDRRPAAAVVSRSFAHRFWPDGGALGRRLKFPLPGSPYSGQWFTVVGIVGDARYRELKRSRLDLYISAAQCPYPVHQFVVRTDGAPGAMVASVRGEVRAIDPALPLDDVVVLSDAVQQQMANPRLTAVTFAAFAIAATGLAALGLGTLVAWRVRLRTRELGIRLALGATPRQVVALVVSDSLLVVGAGVVAGVAGAIVLERFLQSLLFEIRAHDPVTLASVGGLALTVGLLSAYFPARRATSVDPLAALRDA